MNKYIDADKLIKSVKNYQEGVKTAFNPIDGDADYYKGKIDACEDIKDIIISLQQEQPIGEEYAIEIGKDVHTLRVGSQSDINRLIAQDRQEKPEVDLENHTIMEEIRKCGCNPNEFDIARHFYKRGLNARKEE